MYVCNGSENGESDLHMNCFVDLVNKSVVRNLLVTNLIGRGKAIYQLCLSPRILEQMGGPPLDVVIALLSGVGGGPFFEIECQSCWGV